MLFARVSGRRVIVVRCVWPAGLPCERRDIGAGGASNPPSVNSPCFLAPGLARLKSWLRLARATEGRSFGRDTRLRRDVAIKVLPSKFASPRGSNRSRQLVRAKCCRNAASAGVCPSFLLWLSAPVSMAEVSLRRNRLSATSWYCPSASS